MKKKRDASPEEVAPKVDGIVIVGDHYQITGRIMGSIGISDVDHVLNLLISSGIAAGAYDVLKAWVDSRNAKKLRLEFGEIEVEATQMPPKDVLQLLDLLQRKGGTEEDTRSAP